MHQKQPEETPYIPTKLLEETVSPSVFPETKTLIEQHLLRNEAFSQSARDLLFLDEKDPTIITHVFHRTIDTASAAAEANIDLVLSLIKSPSTPETDSLLASHLAELKPGPYSDLVITSLAENARVTGEIKQTLTATLANWQEAHGDNVAYTNDISRLSALVAPKSFRASITDTLKRFFNS